MGEIAPALDFIAITDPGTRARRAGAAPRSSARSSRLPPDVGGRYSALTVFGLVPAALNGVDVGRLLERARSHGRCLPRGRCGLEPRPRPRRRPRRGGAGRPRQADDPYRRSGWPRSATGPSSSSPRAPARQGAGSCRSSVSRSATPEAYGDDRCFVRLTLAGEVRARARRAGRCRRRPGSPGRPHRAWPIRSTSAPSSCAGRSRPRPPGSCSSIDPFDQPNVQESKDATTGAARGVSVRAAPCPRPMPIVSEPGISVSADPAVLGDTPVSVDGAVEQLLGLARPGLDYVAILAYLPMDRRGRGSAPGHPRAHRRGDRRRHDARLRAALPALDRAAPQGRAGHRRLPPDHRRPIQGSADPGLDRVVRHAHRRSGARRPRRRSRSAAAVPSASISPMRSPAWRGSSRSSKRSYRSSQPIGLGLARGSHRSIRQRPPVDSRWRSPCRSRSVDWGGWAPEWRAERRAAATTSSPGTGPSRSPPRSRPSRRTRAASPSPSRSSACGSSWPRRATSIISVPSGDATDAMIDQLAGILEPGDVIIDAGNSRFHDSKRHAAELAEQGIEWLDMGVSGGVWGLQVGFCAMLGGKREVFDRFEPVVKTLAPEDGYLYCGEAGAGHYTKMVHNGIEYGIMQAYGEGFDILHASDYDLDLAAIAADVEQRIGHPLLAARAGRQRLREGGQRPRARSTAGSATPARDAGRWPRRSTTTCPAPIITLALIERFRSRREPDSYTDRVLAALRNEFGGHAIKERDARHRWRPTPAPLRHGAPAQPPPNPLREGLRLERIAEPCTMIICGATGDLTERKLGARALQRAARRLPAARVHRRRLRAARPERRGVPRPPARRASTSTAATVRRSRRSGSRSRAAIEYHRGDVRRSGGVRRAREAPRPHRSRPGHGRESALLPRRATEPLPGDRQPPRQRRPRRERRASRHGGSKRGWTRVIVEKPFGYDLAPARRR